MSDTPAEQGVEEAPAESSPRQEQSQAEAAPDRSKTSGTAVAEAFHQPVTPLQEAELSPSPQPNGSQTLDMDFILDIPLKLTVEVGRTKLLIQELLQLGQGSVIELDKLMGEPFEVMVNEKLVARGDIVVVNDRFGVRLTDITSPAERVQSLKHD